MGVIRFKVKVIENNQIQYAPAMDFYAEAQTIFHLRVDLVQRQNEAAAVYGLALVAALCGHSWRALELTEQAGALLQEAEQHWVMIHTAYERADQCETLRQRIQQQVNFLALPGSA